MKSCEKLSVKSELSKTWLMLKHKIFYAIYIVLTYGDVSYYESNKTVGKLIDNNTNLSCYSFLSLLTFLSSIDYFLRWLLTVVWIWDNSEFPIALVYRMLSRPKCVVNNTSQCVYVFSRKTKLKAHLVALQSIMKQRNSLSILVLCWSQFDLRA